jgi:hypothetical protein
MSSESWKKISMSEDHLKFYHLIESNSFFYKIYDFYEINEWRLSYFGDGLISFFDVFEKTGQDFIDFLNNFGYFYFLFFEFFVSDINSFKFIVFCYLTVVQLFYELAYAIQKPFKFIFAFHLDNFVHCLMLENLFVFAFEGF